MPQEAADQINQVANAFDGDRNLTISDSRNVSAIGFIESKYNSRN